MSVPATTKGSAVVTVPSETEILITRTFNAPRALVYRVFTEPELITRWWAGRQGTVTSVEVDLRVGGRWRYVLLAGGQEVGFHGEYREIVPGERFSCTEVFEGAPAGDEPPPLNTYSFTEQSGRTTLELLTVCGSTQTRDAILGSGMEVGMQEGYDIAEEIAVALTCSAR